MMEEALIKSAQQKPPKSNEPPPSAILECYD